MNHKLRFFLLLLLPFLAAGGAFGQAPETMPGRIVVRVNSSVSSGFIKPGRTSRQNNPLIKSIQPAIPWAASGVHSRTTPHALSDIYFIDLYDESRTSAVIDSLNSLADVLYAEPYFTFRPLKEVNDPQAVDQEHLSVIRAPDAWNIEEGDSTIVIGILDSGVNPDHPDLEGSIAINAGDPVNGIDDDGDGLIDNYIGWDIADDDNNPIDDTDAHGTWVTGVSSARTNNNTGVAGTGYAAKILPIKIFKSNTNGFSRGYEAIALAADLGCDVINLSWGSEGSYSEFGRDVINYAVLEKDVAIVAAAGNTNGELDFYPASFQYVLSVASTDVNDRKASWGTYSRYVDLTAPGVNILTTDGSDGYIRKSGTSLSAPQVAGALALIRSRFPELTALQAMERLRVYSDPIDDIPGNSAYRQLLGKGRLNMYRALTGIGSPAVRIAGVEVSNGSSNEVFRGDSIRLKIELTNYLHPTENLNLTVRSASPYVKLLTESIGAPQLGSNASAWLSSPLEFILSEDTPANEEIRFTIEFEDGAYTDFQHFSIKTAPDHVNIPGGNLTLTIGGNGNLGYAGDLFQNGIGLTRNNAVIMKNTALLISAGDMVADNLPSNLLVPFRDGDFKNELPIKKFSNSIADQYAVSSFDASGILPLHIEQEALSWMNNDAIILEYRITNTSTAPIPNARVALFADFDLANPLNNRAEWIDSLQLSVTSSSGEAAGIALLSEGSIIPLALDKGNANGNSSDLPSEIDDSFKYQLLQSTVPIPDAGQSGDGNDVASMLIKPVELLDPGESILVTFAFAAAGNVSELTEIIQRASADYKLFRDNPPVLMTSYYCPDNIPVINPPGGLYDFYLNADGSGYLDRSEELSGAGLDSLDRIFVKEVFEGERTGDIYQVTIRSAQLNTDFSISTDTLILDERKQTLVQFTDLSKDASSWQWQFSNGYSSDRQHPSIHFTEEGQYSIILDVSNNLGCSESIEKQLVVISRTEQPEGHLIEGCSPLGLTISELPETEFRIYADEAMENLVGTYQQLQFTDIRKDSVLYYSVSTGNRPESLSAPIKFRIKDDNPQFSWRQDSTNINTTTLIHFTSESTTGESNWYVETTGGDEFWLGNGKSVSLDYSEYALFSSFTVRHEVSSVYGCMASASGVFNLQENVAPENINIDICSGDEQNLSFKDSFYHFYAGAELIAKGQRLLLKNITTDTVFTYRDASGLLESEPGLITINVNQPETYFKLPSEPFNMASESMLELSALGDEAAFYSWFLDGISIGNTPDVTINFTDPGTYKLLLEATDVNGCLGRFSQSIAVVNITSAMDFYSDQPTVHPNPASGAIYIRGFDNIEWISIRDISGRLVRYLSRPTPEIDVRDLPGGLYLVEVKNQESVRSYRIIINPGP